ncbi:IS3 family transposase [Marinobacter salarius]|uniref:IS3 family transposase n=1 Tax=Marinobacter salarius TaxID=1420917 RepID=UPI003BAC1C7C
MFNESEGRYGSPKVYRALKRQGIRVGENRVARLMQVWGMKAGTHRIPLCQPSCPVGKSV